MTFDWKHIIAGPCAAESEEQVWTTAQAIAQSVPDEIRHKLIFRAGLWKPRTSPTTFQGIGDEGLAWLQRIQRELDLPVATEVTQPEQLHRAIEAGLRHLWVGARTSANPIQVQALADALQDHDCSQLTVYIKNPVNNDPALWIGNIQRFLSVTGCNNQAPEVYAIHRGCNHRPCWDMAYFLRQQMPTIPLLLDPSHMSGDANRIDCLCKNAVQLQYDGLMVEVHNHPSQALSDAQQQLTPAQFAAILGSLTEEEEATQLTWLRQMMNEVDDELWSVVARRMEVSHRIGEYKREQGMEIVQPTRYEQMVTSRLAWAQSHDLDPHTVRTIMDALHQESIRKQK